jgi:glycosyltransferase involved in cell wall biosynthesis
MNTRKLNTLSIGIPAFNEAGNISKLVKTVMRQKLINYRLDKVIISSDGSTDKTVSEIKKIKSKRISLIVNKQRKGIARGLNQIISRSNSDFLITLDADIVLKDNMFFEKLLMPIREKDADLTSANISALKPYSNYAKIILISTILKKRLFETIKNGNNLYTCYGLARGYSKKFYKKMRFPVSVGNDMFSYLQCLKLGFNFLPVKDAVAWYHLPDTYVDHQKQSARFYNTFPLMRQYFGKKFLQKETKIPKFAIAMALLKTLPLMVLNIIPLTAYLFLQLKIILNSRKTSNPEIWQIATSTKK